MRSEDKSQTIILFSVHGRCGHVALSPPGAPAVRTQNSGVMVVGSPSECCGRVTLEITFPKI